MRVRLFPFQDEAVAALRKELDLARDDYTRSSKTQVISFRAPTGSGKTIIMSALIESVFNGSERYAPQQDAIFVWLSDSPELNEQSRQKIECKANPSILDKCITISGDSFDMEELEDGRVYFLNTQKLAKDKDLVRHSDKRQYTIWETLENTARDKADHLYFIIDEAHRGALGRAASEATSIMQRFIKGYTTEKINFPPMPLVIGMSATPERFNALVNNINNLTTRNHSVKTEDVRKSGLLKERIIVTYPQDPEKIDEMALLDAAASDWKDKCDRWNDYCVRQHEKKFNPIFAIQVKNRTGDNEATATDIAEVLTHIQEKTGYKFSEHEVAHTFGDTGTITACGMPVHHINPSDIDNARDIRVVFFKENLSTGWDCPKAETMMSFRAARDATYVAQLLGRMVRTPLQRHIEVDDILNEVRLFLPYFSKATVQSVVDELQKSEGGQIASEVDYEEYDKDPVPLTSSAPFRVPLSNGADSNASSLSSDDDMRQRETRRDESNLLENFPAPQGNTAIDTGNAENTGIIGARHSVITGAGKTTDGMNRKDIINYINSLALISYEIGRAQKSNYLKSLSKLAGLLTRTAIEPDIAETVKDEIAGKIRAYATDLENRGEYGELEKDVLNFKLDSSVFDAFGKEIENRNTAPLLVFSLTDLDRQWQRAESRLENFGVANFYVKKYKGERGEDKCKTDCILFVVDKDNIDKLKDFAEKRFHEIGRRTRAAMVNLPPKDINEYNSIMGSSGPVSFHNLYLPDSIPPYPGKDGKTYLNHLYADPNG